MSRVRTRSIAILNNSLAGKVFDLSGLGENSIPVYDEVNDKFIVYDLDLKESVANKGVANGYAGLDANGLVPTSQLPGYVDDVLEYADTGSFPVTGTTGKIYVALDTNLTYRWTGTQYTEISASLALGTTSSTAFAGDLGQIAYLYSQVGHLPLAGGTLTGPLAGTSASFSANITGANFYASSSYNIQNKRFVLHNGSTFLGDIDNLGGDLYIREKGVNVISAINGLVSVSGNLNINGTPTISSNHAARMIDLDSYSLTTHTHDRVVSLGDLAAETGRSAHRNGIYSYNVRASNLGDSTATSYYSVLGFGKGTGGMAQLAAEWVNGSNRLYWRGLRDSQDDWFTWKVIWHEGNFDPSNYLLLADVAVSQYANTVVKRDSNGNINAETITLDNNETTDLTNEGQIAFDLNDTASGAEFGSYNSTAPIGMYVHDGTDVRRIWTSDNFGSTQINNWQTAYGWGDHAGLYLGINDKAADANLLDGYDSTYYALFSAYNYSNGYLILTDIADTSNSMITFKIHGNGYSTYGKKWSIEGQLYNYDSGDSILAFICNAINFDSDVYALNFAGKVCLWIPQLANYQSVQAGIYTSNSTPNGRNRVTSIQNNAIPSTGVTRQVSSTPKKIWSSVDFDIADYYTSTEVDTMVGGISPDYIPYWDGSKMVSTDIQRNDAETYILSRTVAGSRARIVIESDGGNINFGSYSTTYGAPQLADTSLLSSNNQDLLLIAGGQLGSGTTQDMLFRVGGYAQEDAMTLKSNGNLLIGTKTDDTVNTLQVVGNVSVDGYYFNPSQVSDANNLLNVNGGAFRFYKLNNSTPNTPTSNNNGNGLLQLETAANYGKQIYFADNEDLYIRQYQASTFKTWRKLWHSGNFDPTTVIDNTLPDTPAAITLTEYTDYVGISFAENTDDIDYYEIYSSFDNINFGLIARVNSDEVDTTVNVADSSYTRKTTVYYKAYAIKFGKRSAERTANITLTQEVADVSNVQVIRAPGAFHLSYTLPDDRRLSHVEIYVDHNVDSGSVVKPATPVFTGLIDHYEYEVADAYLDDYFQFWVDTVTAT